jgi:hypothetical protein
MTLNRRITRLERELATTACECHDNTDLAWPGHTPHETCARCNGKRTIYAFEHNPQAALRLLRRALPLMAKADRDGERNLASLTNHELLQLRAALEAYESYAPNP